MPVRFSKSHPSVEANTGRIALTRGPLVLCAEGVDNDGPVQRFVFDELPSAGEIEVSSLRFAPGISVVQVTVPAAEMTEGNVLKDTTVRLLPYFAWNNRGAGSMMVWFPTGEAGAGMTVAR
jgi:DUF1680 family protein